MYVMYVIQRGETTNADQLSQAASTEPDVSFHLFFLHVYFTLFYILKFVLLIIVAA